MRRIFYFFICVVFFNFFFRMPVLNADSKSQFSEEEEEPVISMDLQDASLKDVLKMFSIQSGLNFIASEGVQERKITLYLDQVPLKKAMEKLFKANNLIFELDRGSNIFIVKDLGKLQAETVTKVFYLKQATVYSSPLKVKKEDLSGCSQGSMGGEAGGGASAGAVEGESGITSAVKKLLTEVGSVIEDPRTNSLTVTDTPIRMEVISQVIASLDVPSAQVLLEVEMLEVNKSSLDKLGVNWPATLLSLDVTGARLTNFPFGGFNKLKNTQEMTFGEFTTPSGNWTVSEGLAASKFIPSVFTVIGANLTLDFLRTQSDTKFLARPRILTLNNETAEVKIAAQESIGVITSSSGPSGGVATTSTKAERAETGIVLRITPQINVEDGEITMYIYPKVAEANKGQAFTMGNDTFQFRDPEERSTKSVVRVKDGETVALGGLIRTKVSKTEAKLPFLGDLPLIGFLFRHTGGTEDTPDENNERELLVFITPHIIKDQGVKLAQKQDLTLPQREQNTVSGNSRESRMSSILDTFDNKNR